MAGQVQRVFKILREGNTAFMKLSEKQIQEMIQRYFKKLTESYDQPMPPFLTDLSNVPPFVDQSTLETYLGDLDYERRKYRLNRNMGEYSEVEEDVDRLLRENGVDEIDKNSPLYWKLCEGLMDAVIKGIEFHKNRLLGNSSDDGSSSPVQGDMSGRTTKQVQTSEEISKIAEEFWNWGVSERGWKPTSQLDFRRALDHFIEYFGKDAQVHTIEFLDMKKYKEGLVDKGLGVRTVGFYLGRAKAFFNYAKQYKHLDRNIDNPVSGLIPKDIRRKDTLSDIFEKADLEKLFCKSKEYFEDKHTKPENFWIPLIAL
jgi:hypothetical protein